MINCYLYRVEIIDTLLKAEITRIVQEKLEREPSSVVCLGTSDIRLSTQYTSQLEGYDDIKCYRNY